MATAPAHTIRHAEHNAGVYDTDTTIRCYTCSYHAFECHCAPEDQDHYESDEDPYNPFSHH